MPVITKKFWCCDYINHRPVFNTDPSRLASPLIKWFTRFDIFEYLFHHSHEYIKTESHIFHILLKPFLVPYCIERPGWRVGDLDCSGCLLEFPVCPVQGVIWEKERLRFIKILNISSELFSKSTLLIKSWKIPKKEPSDNLVIDLLAVQHLNNWL